MKKPPVVLDCEIYPNYFLVAFKRLDNGKTATIEAIGENAFLSEPQREKLFRIMARNITFGFNSGNFDMPIICHALNKATPLQLTELANLIIHRQLRGWQAFQHIQIDKPKQFRHFDIMEPAPGVKVSLKLYGGRLHSQRLQDTPVEPNSILDAEEIAVTKKYCINDLDTTIDLYKAIEERMQLRFDMAREYDDFSIASKSDAQIAETVIKARLSGKVANLKPPPIAGYKKYAYTPPRYIRFETKPLQKALDIITSHHFSLDAKGSIKLPYDIKDLDIIIGKTQYQLGIGGIHSKEARKFHIPNDNELLVDKDVAAYYPQIILNNGYYPRHLGEQFLKVYSGIVQQRLDAKKAGNKVIDKSLKIVINGTFGKLGNRYSCLYSPDLLIHVTITGQLALLMLIERLETAGISVVSANTDGFVSRLPKALYGAYNAICQKWEKETGFSLEETRYKGLFSRDVNNYLAITEEGGHKGKGIFTLNDIQKNPNADICIEAVIALLKVGKPIEETIKECKDLKKFLIVRNVTGGAIWRKQFLGRVVRWIHSTKGQPVYYRKNGNSVPNTLKAFPMMELEALPSHVHYEIYIQEAYETLRSLGVKHGREFL